LIALYVLVVPYLTPKEYEQTQKIVQDFGCGIGRELHHQLLEFAKHKRNWVNNS
jgi:hypothetical protein